MVSSSSHFKEYVEDLGVPELVHYGEDGKPSGVIRF